MQRKPLAIEEISARLAAFMRAACGEGASIAGLKVMEAGHAGLTFGFELKEASGAAPRGLVLKLAPQGVRRSGNTDVYRQAPLLRALHGAGMAVPDVPFAAEDERWFGAPFIVMEKLAGEPFFVWEPDAAFDLSPTAVAPLWEQTVDAMAGLHGFDWQRHLPHWEAPRPLAEELSRWEAVLVKAPDPAWIDAGRRARDRLLATLPADAPLGLVHGDCQPGNALFEAGRLTGLIDWELASIGARWLDIGWLMMLADPLSWPAEWRPLCPLTPAQLAARYARLRGEAPEAFRWFQAFAGYRLGAISCLNVHLHRSGRRIDPTWERFAAAIPPMFARALALVEDLPNTESIDPTGRDAGQDTGREALHGATR